MHPHWNSTPKAPPTTDERIAALENFISQHNAELSAVAERMAAMQATIDELRAKVQAREPIGQPWIGTPIAPIGDEDNRIRERLEAAKQRLEQAKHASHDWLKWAEDPRKEAQPDLFPSHRPVYEPRGYVDPNRPDQAKAHQAMYIPPLGKVLSASVDGKPLSNSVVDSINRAWMKAQADRDGENLTK